MLLDSWYATIVTASLLLFSCCVHKAPAPALLKCDFCDITQPFMAISSFEWLSMVSKILKHKLHIYISHFTLHAPVCSPNTTPIDSIEDILRQKKSLNWRVRCDLQVTRIHWHVVKCTVCSVSQTHHHYFGFGWNIYSFSLSLSFGCINILA